MKHNKLLLVTVVLLFISGISVQAQKVKPDDAKHQQKVKDMVAFLEYVLNTLGDKSTSARDKDVLITESYTKIFRDGKVQVEDDLDEGRNVITNKDVQAYLKDVDFFFDHVKFEFNIEDIQGKVNANGKLFYKVSLTRNLKGTTVEGKTVSNTIPRNVEINYNPDDQDLKIVSIYTNEFDEKEALQQWWKQLSYEWQSIFQRKLNITDSVGLADIRNITSIEELDLSNNEYIQTIEPLAQLGSLRVLNLSNTNISDLTPLRNLTELVELNVARTQTKDITPLKYSDKLVKLNISQTGVEDISVVQKMLKLEYFEASNTMVADLAPFAELSAEGTPALKYLNLKATRVADLSPVAALTGVTELDVSKTTIGDLRPVAGLKSLSILGLDSTRVNNLTTLSNLSELRVLRINHTQVSDLNPLQPLKHLEKIYCDHTSVKQDQANAFMASHPGVLVIFDSEDVKSWWDSLPAVWQKAFSTAAKTAPAPTKEELATVINLDSINLAGNSQIRNLEPLSRLQKLKVILAGKTSINDLSPLREHKKIKTLDISETGVNDLSIVNQFTGLTVFRADNSKIESIDPLAGISTLKNLYVDQTTVQDANVQEFLAKNPECLVVYKSSRLQEWWNNLSENWKQVYKTQLSISAQPKREELHRLVELSTLHFEEIPLGDLSALKEFVRLKELHFSGTGITDLAPLATIKTLRSLRVANSPVQSVAPLAELADLEDVDISNTPVDDLEPLSPLQNLKTLNCAGTQIKKLNIVERLQGLEFLDCSNTNVKDLDPVMGLHLKTLKCYNTRISSRQVENYKRWNPDCNVVYYR